MQHHRPRARHLAERTDVRDESSLVAWVTKREVGVVAFVVGARDVLAEKASLVVGELLHRARIDELDELVCALWVGHSASLRHQADGRQHEGLARETHSDVSRGALLSRETCAKRERRDVETTPR